MPSKIQDKERRPDQDAPKSKDRHRPKASRRKSSSKDPDKASTTHKRHSSHASSVKKTSSMTVPEVGETAVSDSTHGSRISRPYSSFSKAHSKEFVGSRDNVVNQRLSYYTPNPTDLDKPQTESDGPGKPNTTGVAPPSPPLTTMEIAEGRAEKSTTPSVIKDDKKATTSSVTSEDKKRAKRPSAAKEDGKRASSTIDKDDSEKRRGSKTVEVKTAKAERKKSDLQRTAEGLGRILRGKSSIISEQKPERRPTLSKPKNSQRETSRDQAKSSKDGPKASHSVANSKVGTPSEPKPTLATVEDATSSTASRKAPSVVCSSTTDAETTSASTMDSDSTFIAPNQPSLQPASLLLRGSLCSSRTDPESLPRTSALSEPSFPPSRKETPTSVTRKDYSIPGPFDSSPAPPPPPPPPAMPFQMPRVDYLMQNGGLHHNIPRTLLAAGQTAPTSQALSASAQVEKFFAPFHNLLDDYTKVVSRNGSLAVATGYRSIARRLLDRLEAVFARDISSETCTCIICQSSPLTDIYTGEGQGINWGEVLEYVSGRQELPPWPPFILDSAQGGLGISSVENQMPMQNLDIDVPEEFRDHYVRQSKKTKQSVDRWLASQPEGPISAPEDVDDETLTFAMLTRLEPEQRPIFSSLVGVAPTRPSSRPATPLMAPRSSLLEQTGLAIQRLYRLIRPPRDPESAIYLLTNPLLHNVLATLAAISDGEWEILTSGRFDGFLRSGAEDHNSPLPTTSQAPSRGPTPVARKTPSVSLRGPGFFPQSTMPSPAPTPAPASVGAPVAFDEETEIAVLADVEREIYIGMEALEDAFEALHGKAEVVRRALRERSAGLSMAWQSRRGSGNLDARLGTPAEGIGHGGGNNAWESETDDGLEDTWSELAPDDSASSVSRSRVRRPRRRTERRTPAPVEEEDEDAVSGDD